jgi:hypothetical integral membrane protein (TIGR02206 family)
VASWEHLAAVGVAALLCAVLCTAARARPGPWTTVASRVIAVVLVGNLVAWQVVTAVQGRWTVTTGLMLDLCPVSAACAAAALWTRRPLLAELAYFWGCTGSVQGLITPDTRWHFPNFFYFQFYVIHAGVVVAGLFLVIGLGVTPRPHAVRRVFALTLGFAGVCAVADILSGGNYLFLRDTGGGGTLLEVMGPWPWYIATGAALALVLLTLLDAPFRHGGVRPSTERFRPTTPR